MSFLNRNKLEEYLNKGKQKLGQFTGSSSQPSGSAQYGGYPGQQHQQQQQQQPPYGQYQGPPPQQPQYAQYPPQPQYGQSPSPQPPPLQQYGQYPPQPQYGQPPPPQQQYGQVPPLPAFHNRPSSGPPPLNLANKPGAPATSPSYQQQQQQQQQQPPPPQYPYASGALPQPHPYWRAHFNPQIPVSQLFEQETGAHGWGNNESQNYTSDHQNSFFTPDNKLVLRAIVSTPPSPSGRYTSARLISHQKLDRQRGCLTAVLTSPCAEGIWPAFWLLPSKPFSWPTDGEVDIMESWNGDRMNHSCLHWGHFNGEDWNKHRVLETSIPSMGHEPHRFDFTWDQPDSGQGGRAVWYIDGRPVMKATIPQGTRRISDWRVILNVAMGGNVCGRKLPSDGVYDFVVHELKMTDEPNGGWGQFGSDWERASEGKTM